MIHENPTSDTIPDDLWEGLQDDRPEADEVEEPPRGPTAEAEAAEAVELVMSLRTDPPLTKEDYRVVLAELLAHYARIGVLTADARSQALRAYADRKMAYGEAFTSAKVANADAKPRSDSLAEGLAEQAVWQLRINEAEAEGQYLLMQNTLDALRETIQVVKFLGRLTYEGQREE